jgi:hypothetical protein
MTELNITDFDGKTQKLRTLIRKAVEQMAEQDILPDVLVMFPEQYELLKKVPEMGHLKECNYYSAEDRVYATEMNAMEIRLTEMKTLTREDISAIITA